MYMPSDVSPDTILTVLSHHQAKVEEHLQEEITQRKRAEQIIEKQKQDVILNTRELETCQSNLNTEKATCGKLKGDFAVSQVGIIVKPRIVVDLLKAFFMPLHLKCPG